MRIIYYRPIRFGLTILALFSLLAMACRLFSTAQQIDPALPPATVELPSSTTIVPSVEPFRLSSATPVSGVASATPESPTPDGITDLRYQLNSMMTSPQWIELDYSSGQTQRWQEFAAGAVELNQDEIIIAQDFLDRWKVLTDLMGSPLPRSSNPALRIAEFAEESTVPQPVLYVVEEQSDQSPEGEQLFLTAITVDGKAQALLLAPPISGLRQSPGSDGKYVYYYDDKGNWLLRADARPLNKKNSQEKVLVDMLAENDVDLLYSQSSIYPRFYFNLPGILSGFYLVEKLTLNQIKLLIATIQAFDQEPFSELKEFAFTEGENVPFLISREDHPFAAAMAIPLGKTPPQGIILLYSRNLFSSKYETVGGIAHEVVHIWQGLSPGCDRPQARLVREIGDGTIPSDFYDWTAAQIIEQSSKTHQLGAYHMSLWIALHYNLQDVARVYRSIITTGTIHGQSIINCGE